MKFNYLFLFLPISLFSQINIDTFQQETGLDKAVITQVMNFLDTIEQEAEKTWSLYYHVLPNLIKKYNLKIGCEIGVSMGGHSYAILEKTNVEKLYSIDPYKPNATLNLWVNYPYYYDILFLRVKHRLAIFENRTELIRAYSTEVINNFLDNQFDFIFIDGSHEYEDVKNDLELYYNKVRSGGIISGDDYNTGFPGVPLAVNQFFNSRNIPLNFDEAHPRIWWAEKP